MDTHITSFADLTRVRPRAAEPPKAPLSIRHVWHRWSMLGSLALIMIFPWVTTTGCSGDKPPFTYSGWGLLLHSLRAEPVMWIGPVGLALCAILVAVARRPEVATAGRRLLVHLLALFVGGAGVFYTFLGFVVPTIGDHEEHHIAAAAGFGVLVLLAVDLLTRTAIGGYELWVTRRAARRAPRQLFADPAR